MPGRHLTDHQVGCGAYVARTRRRRQPPRRHSASPTAYRIESDPRPPSQKRTPRGSRRRDPLDGIFEKEVVPLLVECPGLRAVTIFEELRRHPRFSASVRRTLGAARAPVGAPAWPRARGDLRAAPIHPVASPCPTSPPPAISGLTATLHHPLSTLHDVRRRPPCKTRFRLAGYAFTGRGSNLLDRGMRFQIIFHHPPLQDLTWRNKRPVVLHLGKAIAYALGQWPKLSLYLDHAQLTPDNNSCEQADPAIRDRPQRTGAGWRFRMPRTLHGAGNRYRQRASYAVPRLASGFLQIPPRDGDPYLPLTRSPVGPVEDLQPRRTAHLSEAHAGRTKKTAEGRTPRRHSYARFSACLA